MKRSIVFLCLLIATLIHSKEIHATGSEFYNGLDACVEEGVQRQGAKWRSFYRPSARFIMFQQVTNLRFTTNQGKWKPEIPVHPQAITLDNIKQDGFPQTYMGAFVLAVFPSPDGVYLIPTQAVSDPLYELSLEKQALLFREVKQHCDLLEPQKNVKVLRSYILQTMGCKKVFSDEERTPFQIHDFKMKLLGKILEDVEQNTAEELAEKNLKIEDENFLIKFIDFFHPSIFDNGYFTQEEVAYYVNLSRKIDRFKEISNIKKKARSQDQQAEVVNFKTSHKDVLLFEEHRKDFYRDRFADTLVRALGEENPLLYPSDSVLRALLTCF